MKPPLPKIFTNVSPRLAIQILIAVILLFCAIYFGLSMFQPFSLNKIIVRMNLKSWQPKSNVTVNVISDVKTTIATNTTTTKPTPITQTTIKNEKREPGTESFICDNRINNDTHAQTNISFSYHRINALLRKF